jgi:hypothetical protein
MNNLKFTSIGLTILVAAFLWATPVWSSGQDTGYPWFGDIEEDSKMEESNQAQQSSNYHLAPLLPPEQDTGYPWYADIKEEPLVKPYKVFGVHPRTTEGDTGYPWHADTKEDNHGSSQHKTTTQ